MDRRSLTRSAKGALGYRMSTKKVFPAIILAAIMLFGTLGGAFASSSAISDETEASDVVVLLDVSQSVLPYFHDITDYVVSSVVKDFLRLGDTFHLLSFGETTQVEIAQRISTEDDVKSVLARLYLLYPLARNTDLVSAFSYLSQYLSDLPESRSKVVVIITDGIHNPSAESPAFGLSAQEANSEIEVTASKIKRNGWPVYIIKVPFSPERSAAEASSPVASAAASVTGPALAAQKANKGAPQVDYLGTIAKSLDANVTEYSPSDKSETARKSLSLPEVVFPSNLGKKGYTFSFPLKVHNSSDTEVGLELQKVVADGSDILSKKSFLSLGPGRSGILNIAVALPPSMESGEKNLGIDLYFADGLRVSPSHGSLAFTLAPSPLASLFKSGQRVVLFIVFVALGLIAILVVISLIRKAPRRAAAPVVAAVRESAEAAKRKKLGTEPAFAATPARPATPAFGKAAPSSVAIQSPVPASAPQASAAKKPAGLFAGTGRGALAPAAKIEGAAEVSQKKTAAALSPSARQKAAPAYEARVARPGTIQIELRVTEQNPHIGMRNVQSIHSGSSRSVGGGRSDFLVFLVPVPHHCAEIHYDGETCTFVPLRPELFPELDGQPLADCVGKEIAMVSKKGYRMSLRFSKYEAPANKINRLLHCIETPGLFQGLDL
jgi:hypothetical protein